MQRHQEALRAGEGARGLAQVTSRQSDGEAVSYEEVQVAACLEVREFRTEKDAPAAAPGPVYGCDHCDKTFSNEGALASHKVWAHPSVPRRATVNWRRPPFEGTLSAPLSVTANDVSVTLLINGKDRAQLAQQAEEAAAALAAAKAERDAESDRRAHSSAAAAARVRGGCGLLRAAARLGPPPPARSSSAGRPLAGAWV